jgi:HlyD family secretion protein
MKYKTLAIIFLILIYGCATEVDKSDAFGNFEAETVIVSSESSGKILQFNIEKGQNIDTDYKVAIIDTVQLKIKFLQIDAQKLAIDSRRASIQSQINVLQEQKKNLQTNEIRIQKMLKDEASTQKQLDDIQGQIGVIDKQIESTKTQFIAISKELEVMDAQKLSITDQLQRCTVQSPVAGTILETYAEEGELTSMGKPLFKVADLNELELKVYVSGAQLPQVKLGNSVEVIIDKSETKNQSLSGEIIWISSEAEFTPKIVQTKEERVKLVYAVKVAVKNDGTLKIGMPGEVVF